MTGRKGSSLAHDCDTQRKIALSRTNRTHTVCADELNSNGHIKRPSQGTDDCPVHRMPPEILGIIFENCVPTNPTSRPVPSSPPLLLGRICGYWRSLSQNTPKLWTSLTFKFLETDLDRSHDGPTVTSAFHTYLHRSSPLPLSLSFTDHRIFQKDTEDIIIWLLLQLRTHAPRWKSIHLQFSSDYFIQLSTLSPCQFTSLASFSVHTDHMGWRHGLISIHLDLTHATRLTALSYTGPERIVREDLLVDWTRLTSISFQYNLHEAGGESSTLPRHFHALSLCANLIELSIGLGSPSARHVPIPSPTTHTERLTLPRLETLRIRRLSRSTHASHHPLLHTLHTPSLHTLIINSALLVGWDGWNTKWHNTEFSSLLRRSGCRLSTLDIRDVDFPIRELGRCLEACEGSWGGGGGLKALTFVPCPRQQAIGELVDWLAVRTLGPRPGTGTGTSAGAGATTRCRFPDLEQIHIGCAHDIYLTPLADMVEGRTGANAVRAGVTPLTSFELVFFEFVHDGYVRREVDWERFKSRLAQCAFGAAGGKMDVRVERPYEPAYIALPEAYESAPDVSTERSRAW